LCEGQEGLCFLWLCFQFARNSNSDPCQSSNRRQQRPRFAFMPVSVVEPNKQWGTCHKRVLAVVIECVELPEECLQACSSRSVCLFWFLLEALFSTRTATVPHVGVGRGIRQLPRVERCCDELPLCPATHHFFFVCSALPVVMVVTARSKRFQVRTRLALSQKQPNPNHTAKFLEMTLSSRPRVS
jgi:hypothetical protein